MTRLDELIPGDLVTQEWALPGGRQAVREPAGSAVYVAQAPHPLWPRLQLVVWRLAAGSWSHDALDARQDVGEAAPSTHEQRTERLRAALLRGPG